MPKASLLIAGLLIAASYCTLTLYDFFALRTIGCAHVPYRVAALTSIISYTIGHSVGATVLVAGAIRFRIYREWGLSLIDVAKIAFVTGLTFWLGNAVVLSIGVAYAPHVASAINKLPAFANQMLAVGVLVAVASYVMWLWPRPRTVGRKDWQLTLPNARSTLIQIGIGIADLSCAAMAMYVLISAYAPVNVHAAALAYVISALLGFASHSPGSIGVFDAAMLLALPEIPKEKLLAALLAFRALYFLLPFTIAIVAFSLREFWAKQK